MKNKTRKQYLLAVLAFLLFYAVLLILLVLSEKDQPGAHIHTIGDAVWYSLVTISTVGYGDVTPVSHAGHIIGIIFLLIYFVYDISIPKKAKYDIKPGTLVTTMLLFIISFLFGTYIDRFSRYPLVYGSLASIILLMLWLYLCAFSVLNGAVLNIVLHHHSQKEEVMKAEEALFDEEFPMTEYQRIVEDDISEYGEEYYDEY